MNHYFSELYIKEMYYSNNNINSYLIYLDKENFILVEAQTALEALERSDISNPYKIIRQVNNLKSIVDEQELSLTKQK